MLVSEALAAHFAPASESGGGANTFTIILGVAAAAGLGYYLYNKWRKGRSDGRDDDQHHDDTEN